MNHPITIRKGVAVDLEELQELFVGTVTSVCIADYNAEQIKVWTSSVDDFQRWTRTLSDQVVLVAQIENKIVGFATLDKGSYIDFLFVHKDYQRKGIAFMLYSAVEKEAERQGQNEITSDVSKTARPFFERVGFTVEKEQTVVRKGVELTNYKMRKVLHKN